MNAADTKKLTLLVAMFSSDYDGEVVNAARAAHRLVVRSGETWEAILSSKPSPSASWHRPPPEQPRPKPQPSYKPPPPPPPPKHVPDVMWCLERKSQLSEWENSFLHSVLERSFLSSKQAKTLQGIKSKLETNESLWDDMDSQ